MLAHPPHRSSKITASELAHSFGGEGVVSFKEFVGIVRKYHDFKGVSKGDEDYSTYVARRDVWDNLKRLTETQVRDVVVGFPNSWQTRIPYDCVPELTRVLRRLSDMIELFRPEKLLTVDLRESKKLHDEVRSLSEIIEHCFATVSEVKARKRTFGFTGTTKIFHMIAPELMVMCDEKIATGYGYSHNAKGYKNFLTEMQVFARTLIRSYQSELGSDETTAVKEILNLCRDSGRTLAKTIDEFNYAWFTLGISPG